MSRLFVGKKVGKEKTKNRWRLGHFQVAFCLCIKTSLSAKTIHLKISSAYRRQKVHQTHFKKRAIFALRLVLKQRNKGTQKQPLKKTDTH